MCRRPSESNRLLGCCVQHPPDAQKVVLWVMFAYTALIVAKAVAW